MPETVSTALCERIARSLERCTGKKTAGNSWLDLRMRLGLTDIKDGPVRDSVRYMAAPDNSGPWKVSLSESDNLVTVRLLSD